MEYQKFNSTSMSADGTGIVDGRLQVLNVTGTPQSVGGGETEYSFLSYLGQMNYTFNNKYSLSASIRRDGSSRFGANNRFATFYAVGGSWKVIDESFMENQKIFDDLRLRASYGTSGVADFGNYVAQQLYSYGQTYDGAPGSAPSTPGNPSLTWEKNKQLDIGLEFSVLKSRLRTTVDWYRRISSELLQNVPVSRTSGFSSAQKNIGELENKGFEITINSTNVNTKNFTWTTDFNVSHNQNKVLTLYKHQDIAGGTLGRTREGQPLNSWFLPVWAGVDPANGDPLWYLADGKTTTNSYATASRTENRKFVGSSLPEYTFGLSNSLNYQGFGLSFFLYAMTGSEVYDQNMSFIDADGLRYGWNYYKDADKNYWRTPGQKADRPKPVIGGNKNSASASTRWIEDNDYLRLRNVTVSYSLPQSVVGRAKLTSARIFVTGVNLATWTKYKGVDPETALSGNDVFKYPVAKSITFGVDISL
jgi:TonB-linked SusC/RagA family outer membrane protein